MVSRKEIRNQEKLRKEKEREEAINLEKMLAEHFRNVIIFPGSKSEFEDFIGFEASWVDLGKKNKGLFYDAQSKNPFRQYGLGYQEKMFNSEIIALVDCSYNYNRAAYNPSDEYYYGIPVKKKKD
jgi:hypothetical protein